MRGTVAHARLTTPNPRFLDLAAWSKLLVILVIALAFGQPGNAQQPRHQGSGADAGSHGRERRGGMCATGVQFQVRGKVPIGMLNRRCQGEGTLKEGLAHLLETGDRMGE